MRITRTVHMLWGIFLDKILFLSILWKEKLSIFVLSELCNKNLPFIPSYKCMIKYKYIKFNHDIKNEEFFSLTEKKTFNVIFVD